MAQESSLETLEKQYFFINRNRRKLLDACTTQKERDRVWRDWTIARDNFHEAQNRVFAENDPIVEQLHNDLKATQEKIEEMTEDLQNIAETLDTITAGVQLASSLIILGSSVA